MQKNFREHFGMFVNKIQNNEPFGFARYSDGEMYILKNVESKLDTGILQIGDRVQQAPYKPEDFKHFNPNEHGVYQQKLVEAYKHKQMNYFKGISCSCCVGKENFDWQVDLHGGDDESLTWANLWVNGNYPLFIQHVLPLLYNKECVFIGHEKANLNKLPFFVKDFRVGYNAFINNYDTIDEIRNWIKENNIQNHLFLFSASTFTNLAVYELFRDYPNNSYIDIGTCLTPMMDMPTERDYLQRFWGYVGGGDLNKICVWN
jgi:hypothetical protein